MNYCKNKEKSCVSYCNKSFCRIVTSLWKNCLYTTLELIPQKIFTSLNGIKIKSPIAVSEAVPQCVEIIKKDFKVVLQCVEIVKKDFKAVPQFVEMVGKDFKVVSQFVEMVGKNFKVVPQFVEIVGKNFKAVPQCVEMVGKDFKAVLQCVEIIKKINSLIFKIVLRGGYYGYC